MIPDDSVGPVFLDLRKEHQQLAYYFFWRTKLLRREDPPIPALPLAGRKNRCFSSRRSGVVTPIREKAF
jgi:hypothetical protein